MSFSYASRFLRRALPPALLLVPAAGVYHTRSYRKEREENESPEAHNVHNWTWRSTLQSRLPNIPPVTYADASSDASIELSQHIAGRLDPKLPTITSAKVRASNGKDKSSPILVTFRDGVYDISEFAGSHPGGDQILLAAGGPLEPYWAMYPQHSTEFVLDLLEEYRVGNLKVDEEWQRTHRSSPKSMSNKSKPSPYDNDPIRHPALIVQSTAPYTAETPASVMVSSQHTPNDLFYVRNHMPVPQIDPSEYRLNIVDKNGTSLACLTLEDLKNKFEKVTISATIQCAGNRRNELNRVKKVKGGGWEIGAISNAKWSGVRLKDVLMYAVGRDATEGQHGHHVCFSGLDEDPVTGRVYSASVPMDILRKHGDTILAYEMNGEELPRDHGYPLRAVIPGVAGARAVKWIGSVKMSEEESTSHWQQQDYRSFSPDVDWANVDFSSAPSIQEMPVLSAICTHEVDRERGEVSMKGYAWSGDGKEIIRVDVSADGGSSWTGAHLLKKEAAGRNEVYDWTLWTATVKLPKDNGQVELACKAIDSAYNTQPDDVASIWNLRGLLNNAWHRVSLSEKS